MEHMEHIYKTMVAVPVWRGMDDDGKRVWADFVISTDMPDRDGDIVEQDWILDSFSVNPVALWAHKHDIPPVGEWQTDTLRVVEKEINGRPFRETVMHVIFSRANPLGQQLGHQVLEKTLRAVSVSFIPHKKTEIRDEKGRITGYRYSQNELLEVSFVAVPAQATAIVTDTGKVDMGMLAEAVAKMLGMDKSVVPYQDLPVDMDKEWSADEAKARVARWAGGPDKEDMDWGKYRRAFLWYDREKPDNLGSYKLPIADVVDGELTAIWRGIVAAMAALMGARGGVDIPEADKRACYDHLVKYYKKVDKEPPEFRELADGDTYKMLAMRLDTLEAQIASIQERLGSLSRPPAPDRRDDLVRILREIVEGKQ